MKCLYAHSLSVYTFEIIFRLFVQFPRLHLIFTYQSYLSPSTQSNFFSVEVAQQFCVLCEWILIFCMGCTSETEKWTNQKKLNANKVAWKIKIIQHYSACFQNGEKFHFVKPCRQKKTCNLLKRNQKQIYQIYFT